MTNDTTGDDGPDRPGSTGAASLTYEIDPQEAPSTAVVRATALLTDTAILDLDPLYDVIDPADLDGTVEGTGATSPDASLAFTFEGCEVTVTAEEVHVATLDDAGD